MWVQAVEFGEAGDHLVPETAVRVEYHEVVLEERHQRLLQLLLLNLQLLHQLLRLLSLEALEPLLLGTNHQLLWLLDRVDVSVLHLQLIPHPSVEVLDPHAQLLLPIFPLLLQFLLQILYPS